MTITADHLRRTASRYLAARPEQREFVGPLLELLDQGVDLTDRREWRGHVTASAVVLNPDGQVLQIAHAASGKWLPAVGGHLEPQDDSLTGAVLRELSEELGLAPEDLVWLLDDPVHIDVFPIPGRETRGESDHLHLDFCFLLTTERTDFRLQADEVHGTDWRSLETLVDVRLREGVRQALTRVQMPAQRAHFLAQLPRAFSAACAVVTDPQDRVLLVKCHNRAPFGPPGGVVEAGESPELAVCRELAEETGLQLPPGRLLAVSWITAGGTSVSDMPGVQFVFDMGTVPAGTPLVLQSDEVAEAAWVAPEDLLQYMGPLRAERIRAVLQARTDGEVRIITSSRAEPLTWIWVRLPAGGALKVPPSLPLVQVWPVNAR
ncbi:NUDIX domain-containing protein [Streptacidiphilus sp. EB129]|uniref:NUDIX domain-containing protein n=1 Tax=Streptacidiphilus sp. EB129 TaxID=3156262 RepID=UPI00351811FC